MNDKGVCKTAPATPGLLNSTVKVHYKEQYNSIKQYSKGLWQRTVQFHNTVEYSSSPPHNSAWGAGWLHLQGSGLHCSVLPFTLLHCAELHCTVLPYTLLYCTVLNCTALYYPSLYCTALCWTALHWTALYFTVFTALHFTVCTALHFTVLHCTALHCLYCPVLFCLKYKHRVSHKTSISCSVSE